MPPGRIVIDGSDLGPLTNPEPSNRDPKLRELKIKIAGRHGTDKPPFLYFLPGLCIDLGVETGIVRCPSNARDPLTHSTAVPPQILKRATSKVRARGHELRRGERTNKRETRGRQAEQQAAVWHTSFVKHFAEEQESFARHDAPHVGRHVLMELPLALGQGLLAPSPLPQNGLAEARRRRD